MLRILAKRVQSGYSSLNKTDMDPEFILRSVSDGGKSSVLNNDMMLILKFPGEERRIGSLLQSP